MNTTQKGIATLIKSAVTSEKLALPDGFDLDEAYKLIKRHHIITLAYVGAVNCGVSKDLLPMQYMFRKYFEEIQRSDNQQKEADRLCAALEQQGIDYMRLKGINFKALYPAPELRKMGDVDILIHEKDYVAVEKILKSFDYQQTVGADHTLNWCKNNVIFEIHIRLMPRIVRYYSYFGDGWDRVRHLSGHRYAMRPEDEYIFLFVHFVKHYRYSGIGCRHLTDIWVYRRAHPELDFGYIENELKALDLFEFHQNLLKTISVWFEDGTPDETTEIISSFVFGSGSWGNTESRAIAQGADLKAKSGGKNVRLRTALFILFLPYADMKKTYPVLQKCPVLLPLYWAVRGFDTLFFRRKSISKRLKEIGVTTPEHVAAYEADMKKVGLRYLATDADDED